MNTGVVAPNRQDTTQSQPQDQCRRPCDVARPKAMIPDQRRTTPQATEASYVTAVNAHASYIRATNADATSVEFAARIDSVSTV